MIYLKCIHIYLILIIYKEKYVLLNCGDVHFCSDEQKKEKKERNKKEGKKRGKKFETHVNEEL